jgi:hypothetical protein
MSIATTTGFTGNRARATHLVQNAMFELSADAVNTTPAYRYPFNVIFERTKIKNGRGGGIRTPDPLVPNQMRYQTALRPD